MPCVDPVMRMRRILVEKFSMHNSIDIISERSHTGRHVFLVDREWIFKVQYGRGSLDLRREIELTGIMSGCPLRVPSYRYIHTSSNLTCGGYRMIEGEGLGRAGRLSPVMMGQFHEFRSWLNDSTQCVKLFKAVNYFTAPRWALRYRKLIKRFSVEAVRLGIKIEKDILDKLLDRFEKKAMNNMKPSLIHGDLYRDNVIVDLKEGKLNGVIDFGDACIADPALDYAAFTLDFPSQMDDLLRSSTEPMDENFPWRMMFYFSTEPIFSFMEAMDRGESIGEGFAIEMNTRLEKALHY